MEGAAGRGRTQNVIDDSTGLKLVVIPLSWMLALKLRYFTPEDEEDVVTALKKAYRYKVVDETIL